MISACNEKAVWRTGYKSFCFVLGAFFLFTFSSPVFGQPATAIDQLIPEKEQSNAITFEEPEESLEERLERTITLDVREMSILDIIRFLALKGDFNVVTSVPSQGRATFYLKRVTIRDALDIAVLSNNLAYTIEKDIIRVMTGQEYEMLYGKKFNDKNIVEIVRLKYAKPSYVLATLENIKSNLGRIIIDEETGTVVMIDTPQSIEEMKKTLEEIESPSEIIVYSLQYAKADVTAERLKAELEGSKVGSVSIDERTNKLFIRVLPGRRKDVEKIIASVDSPTKEVLVEARVLQIVFKPKHDTGIDWNLDFRRSDSNILRSLSFNSIFLDEDTLSSSDNLFSNYAKVGYGDFTTDQFEMAIRALDQVNDTKILSNPRLLVTNNEEAKIHVGDTVPYIISTTSGTGENAITSEDVRFVDVGLKLNVTPTINDDGFVTMALKPEISTVTTSISSQGGGIPQVNKTLVETTVMVQDGMTIVLGGLKKENKIRVEKGIPLLKEIPFLGKLFSSDSESIEATEIVIFITPHIISGTEDHSDYRGDIKPPKKYKKDEVPAKKAKKEKLGIKE